MFENLLFGTSNMCIIVSYAIMLLRAIIEYEFEFEEARVRLWTDISALAGKLNAQSSYRSLFGINSIGQLKDACSMLHLYHFSLKCFSQ